MVICLHAKSVLRWPGHEARTVIGDGGIVAADIKREGDGATPAGVWRLRRIMYRADWVAKPVSCLPVRALSPDDGWCDAPSDPAYNRPVRLPYPASCEQLWRDDHVYDLLGVLDHNDHPPRSGLGSAIFLHLARKDYSPTRGCLALAETDLLALFSYADTNTRIEIPLQ